jgi:hypothetical protein
MRQGNLFVVEVDAWAEARACWCLSSVEGGEMVEVELEGLLAGRRRRGAGVDAGTLGDVFMSK